MSAPNIIIISSDQHRGDCLGVEGRAIRTPHLDQLARDGARFTNCTTPSVVCQPARASILTGQLCRTHGVHDNGIDLDPEIGNRGFAGTLAKAGYQTAFFGKAHFSTYHTNSPTGTPECVVSSANYPPDWNGPYMGFDHVEMMLIGHNWFAPERPPRGQHYERFYAADGHHGEKQELYWANGGDTKGAAQCWHSQLPLAHHNTPWTADRAIDWLRHGRDAEQPFCTWISFPDPHHPFDCPEPWSRLHDPETVDLPRHRTRDLERRPWWHEAALTSEPTGSAESVAVRKSYSRIPPQSDAQLREIIANTYGQIAFIDDQIGRILNAVEEQGLSETTFIIYISDHGDWLGDHGLILKGPMFYEGLLRVPMLIRGPGIKSGQVIDTPVSTMDLAPTFYALGGTEPQLDPHGADLMPVLRNGGEREFSMSEWELLPGRVGVALSLRCVRSRTHKLTMDMRSQAGEMYDLINDPDEMTNIFDDPDHVDQRNELIGYLHQRPDDMGPINQPVGTA